MWKQLLGLLRSDNLLKQAWAECFEMLDVAKVMFDEAVRVLRESDSVEMSADVMAMDQKVDAFEQDVRKKVLTHCAVQNADIPAAMVLVTIVIDLERIGDYIKNCVKLAREHPERLSGGKYEPELKRLEEAVKKNFVDTRACLEADDPEMASGLLEEFGWVKALCDDVLHGLLSGRDETMSSGQAVALALYFRWLRRINSHLHNLNTSVANPFDRIGFKPPVRPA
jgi:phosphate transport system protein